MTAVPSPLRAAPLLLLALAPGLAGQTPASWRTLYSYEGSHAFHKFGDSIETVGDIDGDTVPDFMVGARESTVQNTSLTPGSITIYSGATGLELLRIDGTSHNSALGTSLSQLGDINADGVPDFVAGDPMFSIGSFTFEGGFWVYSGADGSVLFWEHGTPNSFFGQSIVRLGDMDFDGLPEFAVSAPAEGAGGAVHIYSPGTQSIFRTIPSPSPNASFGSSLASGGDFDGDVFTDLIVGADRFDGSAGNDIGAVYLMSIMHGTVIRRIDGWDSLNGFGASVALMGDLNGDGTPDLAASAPFAKRGANLAIGAVEFLSGSDGSQISRVTGNAPNENFGTDIASVGDQDGDGTIDLLVGAPYRLGTNGIPGAAVLLSGQNRQEMHCFPNEGYVGFGRHLAKLHDIDGDGFHDIGISSPEALSLFQGAAVIFGSRCYLSASATQVSAGSGGTLLVDLELDEPHDDFDYQLLASLTPGWTTVAGLSVPLGMDSLLQRTTAGFYPPFVTNAIGALNNQMATCTVSLPPSALGNFVGGSLFLSFIAGDDLAAPTVTDASLVLPITP